MYIFEKVIAAVRKTTIERVPFRYEFDFYQGTVTKPFAEAKKAADRDFLADRVAQLHALYASGKEGTVELTSETSKVRGYQGGFVHFVRSGSKIYLIAPLRGRDAPSSPYMLDIQAGRLNLDNAEEQQDSWQTSLYRKGFEVGYFCDQEGRQRRFIPQLPGSDSDARHCNPLLLNHFTSSYNRMTETASLPDQNSSFTPLLDIFDGQSFIRVHKPGKNVPETFRAGWAALPYLSSIELFQYALFHFPSDTRFIDLNWDERRNQPVNRCIYAIDCATGMTEIWESGNPATHPYSLSDLLAQNTSRLEGMQLRGELRDGIVQPVSPKLVAAVQQLPHSLRRHDMRGLAALLNTD